MLPTLFIFLLAGLLGLACSVLPPPPIFSESFPIWSSSNTSSNFVLFRSPSFVLRSSPVLSATLYFSASGSPRPPAGTTQPKLLGGASLYVNGVFVGAGPGHTVPTSAQDIRAADLTAYLRGGGAENVLGIASFYQYAYAKYGPSVPKVQAILNVTDAQGSYALVGTSTSWGAWNADTYFNPTGNASISWYPFPNEDLNRSAFLPDWSSPGAPPPAPFVPATLQPAWSASELYFEEGPIPVTLQRYACSVLTPPSVPGRQIIDYGQEMMGGVNLTFFLAASASSASSAYAPGTRVVVTVAEELLADGSGVLSPARTGNCWNSTWTLSGGPLDVNVVHHEFIQFRYAQVDGSPVPFTAGAGSANPALAWVVQHPAGGDGRNPWENTCSKSVPATTLWGAGGGGPTQTPLASWSSSEAPLDAVYAFCAYTIVATSLDVNVDGQTRERDVDVVDALINARGQFAILSPGDYSISQRTALEIFTNDTTVWGQWYDFKASAVMLAGAHGLYTGDFNGVAGLLWSQSDSAITADGSNGTFNSLQFYTGIRYWNSSGRGLFSFPANGSCGGSWACEPLVDWPTGTRDGYVISSDNSDDTVRSSLGCMALDSIASIAAWLGHAPQAARYAAMADATRASLTRYNLRGNGTEAYYVDGAVGAAASHAAVHSTLYAASAGAADGNATLADALVAFLARHGVPPTSCMTGRWWLEALYRLGTWSVSAADLAYAILTAEAYPSWLDMLAQGATTTMEAWRPADKTNLDWAHPWCASPSFTIPSLLLGVQPTAPGWTAWRVWPQPPSSIANFTMSLALPSPAGMLSFAWSSAENAITLSVLDGQTAQVCLPGAGSNIFVNGKTVQSSPMGRMLCAVEGIVGPVESTVVSRG